MATDREDSEKEVEAERGWVIAGNIGMHPSDTDKESKEREREQRRIKKRDRKKQSV